MFKTCSNLQDSVLLKNRASLGAGGCIASNSSLAYVELVNSTASEHIAGTSGGVLYSASHIEQLVVQGVKMTDNIVGSGGGCLSLHGSLGALVFQASSATSCKAAFHGGVLEVSARAENITIRNLTATNSGAAVGGGAIAAFTGTIAALNIAGLTATGCLAGAPFLRLTLLVSLLYLLKSQHNYSCGVPLTTYLFHVSNR